jgi:hypothetical protein
VKIFIKGSVALIVLHGKKQPPCTCRTEAHQKVIGGCSPLSPPGRRAGEEKGEPGIPQFQAEKNIRR